MPNKITSSGIPIYCAFDEIADVTSLVPNPRNPNQHPENQIKLLAKIIKNQGWRAPITVSNRSGFIVRGHGRLMAAKLLGLEQVPVDRQDYATEDEEWADLIADNRIAELADLDNDLLTDLLWDLKETDLDIELTGFSGSEVDELLSDFPAPEVREDNFDPVAEAEQISEPVSQPGDIWLLGRHRLMCGDATLPGDIERLMDGNLAGMVFTDPPYNVDYQGKTEGAMTIKNDNMDSDSFYRFLYDAFSNMIGVTVPGGAIYICHADTEGVNFRKALVDAGGLLKQCIIWVKNQFILGRQDYQWRHEPILYGWKPGAAHKWYGGRKQSTVIQEESGVVVRPDEDGFLLTISMGLQYLVLRVPKYEVIYEGDDEETTVWRFDKPLRNGDHPTMKPVGIPARAIQNSSRPGDIVLDLFLGGGSTLIAAEQIGRTCYGMELDPVYCDVIVKRWEEFTGQKASLLKNAA